MKIWVPRANIIEPRNQISLPSRVKGRYKMVRVGPDGRVRQETQWFDNLILDNGLNRVGESPTAASRCVVGTGSTAPTIADTQLDTFLASTTTIQSANELTNSSSPYGIEKTITYRFGEGVAAGNLTEVGVGWVDASLFSRALIEDGGGSPTVLTVQADEFLDVVYQLTVFPPLVDATGSIDISGTNHNFTMRGSDVDSNGGWRMNPLIGGGFFRGGGNSDIGSNNVYDGAIGAINGSPAGSLEQSTTVNNEAYVADSFEREYSVEYGLSVGNFGGGILSTRTVMSASGTGARMAFQCEFDPVIPKTSSDVLTLNFRHSWARA